MQDRKNIQAVLVHPTDDKNIGFVARALKTMGLRSLAVISKRGINLKQAGITAVHAKDIIAACRVYDNLEYAVQNSVLVAGITRRTGSHRKYLSLTPEELAERVWAVKKGEISLVFGNEKHGLSDHELGSCHVAVNIPSSPLFPSLNLSHAVQVISYVLYRHSGAGAGAGFSPVAKNRIDSLAQAMTGVLKRLGLYKSASYADIGVFFQDILARAGLSDEEALRLESIISQAEGLLFTKNKSAETDRPY